MMKSKVLLGIMLIITSSTTLANTLVQKYHWGDCITPTSKSYSWYGKYAIVEAFTPIKGFTNNNLYVLAFPFSGSNSAIFNKKIENETRKVEASLCEVNGS